MEEPSQLATLGAGAVVLKGDQVLLVQLNYGPARGKWILPGGYVNEGEHPEQAAVREVREETGVVIAATDLIAVRYRLQGEEESLANVYWVFRAKAVHVPSRLVWPEAELQEARFWSVADARSHADVRPQTRIYIDLAESASRRGLEDVPAQKDSDTMFGLRD